MSSLIYGGKIGTLKTWMLKGTPNNISLSLYFEDRIDFFYMPMPRDLQFMDGWRYESTTKQSSEWRPGTDKIPRLIDIHYIRHQEGWPVSHYVSGAETIYQTFQLFGLDPITP